MADMYIPQSDKGFKLNFTVQNDDGSAFDLSGYTVTFKVWHKYATGNPLISGACTIVVAASGTCYYTLQAGDIPNAAHYNWELELTKSGVIESTRHYTLSVEESA